MLQTKREKIVWVKHDSDSKRQTPPTRDTLRYHVPDTSLLP